MKKKHKVIAVIVIVAILGAGFWIADGFFGNPVSYLLANGAAERYLATAYKGADYAAESAVYNFKFDCYGVKVYSATSRDSHFSIYVNKLGRVLSDSFDEVSSGRNTLVRINEEYMRRTEDIFAREQFGCETSYAFGTLLAVDEEPFGIDEATLQLDAEYDVAELGARCGRLHVLIHDETVSAERAAELLLRVKALFGEAALPFYDIDFGLCQPFTDSEAKLNGARIDVSAFPCSAIYEDGLAERLGAASEETGDAKK